MSPTPNHDMERGIIPSIDEAEDEGYSEDHHIPLDGEDPSSRYKTTAEFSGLSPPPSKPPLTTSNSSSTPSINKSNQTSNIPFPPLKTAQTHQSTSAIEAAEILANFSTHPSHPRNWSRRQKWKITFTVAVTGFIATTGSSIGVPGIHAIIQDFGISNQKLGVLVTSTYVLGFG